ncbi:MAG: response regulator [Deltaproteobacteria bacterium]|nr:response regulator [Deltaproteobacteria bacterium]
MLERLASLRHGLAFRVYGIAALALVSGLGTFAFLQAQRERRLYRDMVLAGASATVATATETLARDLVLGDYAAIDDALRQVARMPSVLSLRVCEPDGRVLSEVSREAGEVRLAGTPSPTVLQVPPRVPPGPREVDDGATLEVWHPITAGDHPLGWLRATLDLSPLRVIVREQTIRAFGLALALTLACVALLTWSLRRPLGNIRRVAGFARQLDARKGEALEMPQCVEEVDQLRDALNAASAELQRSEHRLLHDAAEKQALSAQLLQAQKMEALGLLAGGVAHDFNNILTAIIGYANLALSALEPGRSERDDLEQILVAAERAAALTKSLLAFSRKQPTELGPVDLRQVLAGMEKMVKRLVGEDIQVQVTSGPERVVAMADGGQVGQILLNLAANARDAMPRGGTLSITIGRAAHPPPGAWEGGPPEEAACLTVADTGAGMEESVRQRIFEPFFTTKGLGRGTGLGLSIVHGVVTQHKGAVEVLSEPGRGTTFRVFLPLAPDGASALARETPLIPAARGSGSVLLVEDDPQVNRIVRLTLEEAGYTVTSVENGRQGVAALSDGRRFDLLVSDVIMPEMNGVELLAEARRRAPGLPAILMSGYTADALERSGPLPEGVELLQKPVTPQRIRAKVQEALAPRH